MTTLTTLSTPRLTLVPFEQSHLDGLAALNADIEVMRHISGRAQTRAETIAFIERVKGQWQEWGFSWWSFLENGTGEVIGAGGIQYLERDPRNPLEIAWRLRPDKWHQGFAGEAAHEMARFAFATLLAHSLCAICRPENVRSAAVMERLGMRYVGIEHWYAADMSRFSMSRGDWQQRVDANGL